MLIRHDPDVGHIFVPNLRARLPFRDSTYFVVTNSQGFRSDFEFTAQKTALPRILMFGDSYTAGDDVSNCDRYSDQLAGLLNAEVQNFGIPGSGTDQHLLIRRKFAEGTESDLAIICVQIDSFHRIQVPSRPSIDRITGKLVAVPKPYFELIDGKLHLRQVPVPVKREAIPTDDDLRSGRQRHEWYDQLHNVYLKVPGLRSLRHSGAFKEAGTRVVHELHRATGKHPYPDIESPDTPGWKLMSAILKQFIEEFAPTPVMIVPIPTREFSVAGVKPVYQKLFDTLEDRDRGIHVCDVSTLFTRLPWRVRQQMVYEHGAHFTPEANRLVAEQMAAFIRERELLPRQSSQVAVDVLTPSRGRCDVPAVRTHQPTYLLGVSCFYHNSAAALIRDGEIVGAAEEERFTRIKNDRRFPRLAVNYCLEEAGISQNDLKAIVYYDNVALTFERLCHSIMATERAAAKQMWNKIMPSWLRMKLHFPRLIREHMEYHGEILTGVHHRSHAASSFYPSPFDRAATLTIDGVGEWATASIGRGEGSRLELLQEMHFPHSLGLLYSAFTQFTGFKVNSGEYKMMGLAPYGEPKYAELILDRLVDLKADGSVELNLDYFGFLDELSMTNEKFAGLFGGPARNPNARITRREVDLARSIQLVTEEAILRMARHAKKLTGEDRLCLAGGVALNCVANGRLLREGPFKDIWIQPAAGDSGCALGAALDGYYTHFGGQRRPPHGVAQQGGSYFGPSFSGDEIESYLQTHGYPYRKLSPGEREQHIVQKLTEGKIAGHFAGRLEFGPRALGARSIVGDSRNPEMQATLNLRIKYRESFRPFAPAVLAEKVSQYFDLDRESPYMLIVAPVKEERRLPSDVNLGEDDDLLPVVRRLRSDLPAITHVDYSARIQTVRKEHLPEFYKLIEEFERQTGCAVIVNTSFNVRGEPIVCTPQDAYRCFMRTEMDVLILGDYLLLKEEQPAWPEPKGEGLENEDVASNVQDEHPADFLKKIGEVFEERFWPIAELAKAAGKVRITRTFQKTPTEWRSMVEPDRPEDTFESWSKLYGDNPAPAALAGALLKPWANQQLAEQVRPAIVELLRAGLKREPVDVEEKVSDSVYVMF